MSIVSTIHSASISLGDDDRRRQMTISRIRPDITGPNVASLIEAVNFLRKPDEQVATANLTVTEFIAEAD